MSQTTTQRPATSQPAHVFERAVAGTLLGFVSAVAYTAANICLRKLIHCDPVWVSCVKTVPTVLMVSPLIVWRACAGKRLCGSWTAAIVVIVAATIAQLGGNVAFQWSLGIIGMALAVPVTLGTVIIGGTALGRFLLGEPVTPRTLFSIVMIVAAIAIFSLGAEDAYRSIRGDTSVGADSSRTVLVMSGVLMTCVAGFAYSALGAAIRWTAIRDTPIATTLLLSGIVGMFGLGALVVYRGGVEIMLATDRADLGMMLLAGIFNAIAFLSLAAAMHWTGLVHVTLLNGSQTAMAALAGVVFMNEAPTWALGVGVALTIVGLLIMRPTRRDR